jgi:hypothetical protein
MNTQQNSSFIHRMTIGLRNFGHQLIHNTSNPHLVGRDHRHLSDEYRRHLIAPDVAIHQIAALLQKDGHFVEACEDLMGQYLIRACLIGDELRANVYRLERFPGGPLSPSYNDDWRSEGIVHILMETDGINHKAVCLTNEQGTQIDLSYDYYEPCMSYVRELNDTENATISRVARPAWRQAA